MVQGQEDGRYAVRERSRTVFDLAKSRLQQLLLAGEFPPGSRLPSESELGPMLGISRPTLREVLRSLSNEGLIVQRHGIGTFVAVPPPIVEEGLEELESFDRLAARNGWHIGTEHVIMRRRRADDLAQMLGTSGDDAITEVRRVRTAEGRPVAYMCDYVPEAVLAYDELKARFTGSVLDLILARGEPRVEYCYSTLSPALASGELASLLDVRRDTLLVLVDERLHGPDGEPFEYSQTWFVTDRVRLHLIRRVKQHAERGG